MSHPRDKEYLQAELDTLKGMVIVDAYVDEDTVSGYTELWPVLVFDIAQNSNDHKHLIAMAVSLDMEGNGPGYLMRLNPSTDDIHQ